MNEDAIFRRRDLPHIDIADKPYFITAVYMAASMPKGSNESGPIAMNCQIENAPRNTANLNGNPFSTNWFSSWLIRFLMESLLLNI